MRPRRTHHTNTVFRLPGGTEDNDLWLEHANSGTGTVLRSTWVPTDDERARIAAGENIELAVYSQSHPPVSMRIVNHPLGAPPAHTN